ncbi:hypothetical protein MASR2M29_22560 [Spirochaetota bacterium]
MPSYEYECRACGYKFERVQSMSDEPVKECPKCGKEVRRIIFGGTGVIFRGSGFYINDSKGSKDSSIGKDSRTASIEDRQKAGASAISADRNEGKTAESPASDKKAEANNTGSAKESA